MVKQVQIVTLVYRYWAFIGPGSDFQFEECRFEAQIVDDRRLGADASAIALLHMKTKTSPLPLPLF